MIDIKVKSTIDESIEPSLFYEADNSVPRPLLVGLHTWSANRFNQIDNMLPYAKKLNWNLVLPEFRGGNLPSNLRCREACGSKLAKQDIVDVVEYIKANYRIDCGNIFLLGASGGGHMALLTAAYAPLLWKAVASFVPITNLERWYKEMLHYGDGKYAQDIAACCGGLPSEDNRKEYEYRSPIFYVNEISKANVKIFHGKYDRQVFPSHSFDLFAEIMNKYLDARVFLDIFDGEHEQRMDDAMMWFDSQMQISATTRVTG